MVFDTQNAKLLDTGWSYVNVVIVLTAALNVLLLQDVGSVEFTTDAIVVKNVAPKVLLRFNLPYTGLRLEVIRVRNALS